MSSSALRFYLSRFSSEMRVSLSLCPSLSCVCTYVSLCISLFLSISVDFFISLSVILFLYTMCMHVCVSVFCLIFVSLYLCLYLSLRVSLSCCLYLSLSVCLLFSISLFLHPCLYLFLFLSLSSSISHPVPPPANTTQHMWAEGLSPFPPNSSPLAAAYSFPILASPARPSWALKEGGQRGREGSLVGPPLFAFLGWEAGPVWAF